MTQERYPSLINGKWSRHEEWAAIKNPFDDSIVGEVGVATSQHMEDAIEAADRSFSTFRKTPVHRRVTLLESIAKQLEGELETFARLMTLESGKPIRLSRAELGRSILTFKLGAVEAQKLAGEVIPIDLEARSENHLCMTTRVPRGPVAAISPFNFPLNLVAHKLSPALGVGTTTVLKAPPQCPLVAHRLARIFETVGVPAGVANLLHCSPSVAQVMVEDPRLNVLSFTGSDTVGWKLKALAGKKQVLLELGGNAPCIIDEGTSLESIMPSILNGAWSHGGQICIKIQRILVHQSLFDSFLELFVAETKKIKCGDPMKEETLVGPLIDKNQRDRVLSWIDEAIKTGAKRHSGGEADGNVVKPTILTHVTDSMRVCKDEVFGPVTVVEPFKTFDEALERCNSTRFGLQVGVFTSSVSRALQAYRELDYGGVLINQIPTFRVDNFPYGGTKDSGFGREGVGYAMEEMTEPKVFILRGV